MKFINRGPLAHAGKNQIITPFIDSVNLDGSLSSDPDVNSILKYSWKIIKSTNNTIIRNPSQVKTVAAQLSPGYHEFELTVTDEFGWADMSRVSFLVGNDPHLGMSAGTDTIISLPYDRVWLGGSLEDPLSFESAKWRQIEGPVQATVLITHPTYIGTAAGNLGTPGIYKFELTVKNKLGMSATDTVTVSVVQDVTTYARNLIFDNLNWSCPWGCGVSIPLTTIPTGNPILVYIKTPPSTQFELVGQAIHPTSELLYRAIYWYENGQLSVLNYNENLKSEVKVRY